MQLTKSLLRRMEKLQARMPPPRARDEEDRRFADAFLYLVESLDTPYRVLVMADMDRPRIFDHLRTNLTMAVAHYVRRHLDHHSPLALPAVVAAVYAQNPKTKSHCSRTRISKTFGQSLPVTNSLRPAAS